MGGDQVSEPAKTEEIVHPRTDFRDAMKAAGATDAEIEALMLVQARIDGWVMLGMSWFLLLNLALFDSKALEALGISANWSIALGIVTIWLPVLTLGFLVTRSARLWIAKHESRLDWIIIPNIRYRASENTFEEYLYGWIAMWIIQGVVFSVIESPGLPLVLSFAASFAVIILGTIYRKTGSVRISAPVRWRDETIYPHQVKATAGSVVGQFQSQLTFYTWEEIKKERALTRADHAALYARREGRRPK